jgi:hypothetical protein
MVYNTGYGGGGGLSNVLYTLQYWGIMDVLLPFILIFTVVFAIMQKVQPLGGENDPKKKTYNIMIALVMGLAVVIPHVMGYYPANADVVNIINSALPQVSIVLVAILMVLLIVGLFGGKAQWGGAITGWIAFFAFILVVYIFGRSAGWFQYLPNWLYWLDNPDTQAMLIVVAVFAIIIYFITKEDKPTDKGSMTKFGEAWKGLFEGKK